MEQQLQQLKKEIPSNLHDLFDWACENLLEEKDTIKTFNAKFFALLTNMKANGIQTK